MRLWCLCALAGGIALTARVALRSVRCKSIGVMACILGQGERGPDEGRADVSPGCAGGRVARR